MGNTETTSIGIMENPVHPHACGEHVRAVSFFLGQRGSSPRLWGTPRKGYSRRLTERFIPTPVGNTLVLLPPRRPATVHPHACGEHEH
ncbi:hypothetical protein D1AOALGA4SA_11477 [Olavius algarvensis Delta 1 endosymbiont]|nr:hypothetical protein D1AOALGA4SA_11477 [Olavius algarvensis Delta 1 endosymbiont]